MKADCGFTAADMINAGRFAGQNGFTIEELADRFRALGKMGAMMTHEPDEKAVSAVADEISGEIGDVYPNDIRDIAKGVVQRLHELGWRPPDKVLSVSEVPDNGDLVEISGEPVRDSPSEIVFRVGGEDIVFDTARCLEIKYAGERVSFLVEKRAAKEKGLV